MTIYSIWSKQWQSKAQFITHTEYRYPSIVMLERTLSMILNLLQCYFPNFLLPKLKGTGVVLWFVCFFAVPQFHFDLKTIVICLFVCLFTEGLLFWLHPWGSDGTVVSSAPTENLACTQSRSFLNILNTRLMWKIKKMHLPFFRHTFSYSKPKQTVRLFRYRSAIFTHYLT